MRDFRRVLRVGVAMSVSSCTILTAVLLSGCSTSSSTQPARAVQHSQPTDARLVRIPSRVGSSPVFGVPGTDLLLVHEPAEDVPRGGVWIPRIEGSPLLPDGSELRSTTFALLPRPDDSPRNSTQRWLGDAYSYESLDLSTVAQSPRDALARLVESPGAVWLTLIELPSSVDHIATPVTLPNDTVNSPGLNRSVQSLTIRMGDTPIPVRMLPQGVWTTAVAHESTATTFHTGLSELQAAERRAAFADALFRAATDPLLRWRLDLLADTRPDLSLDALGLRDLEDPRLNRVARAIAQRWRLAMNRLDATHPEIALRMTRRLTAVSEVPSGAWLPMWPPPSREDQRLLAHLTDPRTSADERADIALTWLDQSPGYVAVVLNDAANGAVQIAAIDVGDMTADISVRSSSFRPTRVPRPRMLGTSTVRLQVLPQAIDESPIAALTGDPTPRVGEQILLTALSGSQTLAAPADSLPAMRPGAVLGPLYPAWTRDALFRATPETALLENAAALVLRRNAAGTWVVQLQCTGEHNGDTVTFFVDQQEVTIPRAQGKAFGTGWIASLELDSSSIADSVIDLAVVRRQADGTVSSWPRPMLPMQLDPGRIRIDLNHWDGPMFADDAAQ